MNFQGIRYTIAVPYKESITGSHRRHIERHLSGNNVCTCAEHLFFILWEYTFGTIYKSAYTKLKSFHFAFKQHILCRIMYITELIQYSESVNWNDQPWATCYHWEHRRSVVRLTGNHSPKPLGDFFKIDLGLDGSLSTVGSLRCWST